MTRATRDRESILRKAILIRLVEERLLRMFARGELAGTVHTTLGQELCAAVVSEHLSPEDKVFSNHRCHGHYLAATGDTPGLVAEVMGRQTGVNGGRGGSQHLFTSTFLSTGVQGGCVPIAAGTALAAKIRGEVGIAVCFIGDGTMGEGIVYEVLNLASLWQLPVLFVVENNRYAQSTPTVTTLAGSIAERAGAFGVAYARADTWNWENLWSVAGEAFSRVRSGGPFLLEVDTYRLGAHSKGDDDRDTAEIAGYRAKDPINVLLDAGDPALLAVLPLVETEVAEAFDAAAAAPPARFDVETGTGGAEPRWRRAHLPATRAVDDLRSALDALLRHRDDAILIGEDIESPYGGAFKVTDTLSRHHPGRVLNTPISEAAIVGVGTGLALQRALPLVEVMFGDFVTLAADQLVNHAAKLGFLGGPGTGGRAAGGAGRGADVVVRTPMGGGRGYGPTHSQTLESMFFGVPGLRVVALNDLVPPHLVIEAIGRGGLGPVLLVENKALYGRSLGASIPAGFELVHSDEPLPTAWLRSGRTPDVTLLGYGGVCDDMVRACADLFLHHEVFAQVLCHTQVRPWRLGPYKGVIGLAPVLVIVEEGHGFAGFGAEVAAQIVERDLAATLVVRRVTPAESSLPAGREAERAVLPTVEDIVMATLKAVDGRRV